MKLSSKDAEKLLREFESQNGERLQTPKAEPRSKGSIKAMNITSVYKILSMLSLIVLFISVVAEFVFPLFDPNIAKVLILMSAQLLLILAVDYLCRGRGHEGQSPNH
jgi:hypothetical protein